MFSLACMELIREFHTLHDLQIRTTVYLKFPKGVNGSMNGCLCSSLGKLEVQGVAHLSPVVTRDWLQLWPLMNKCKNLHWMGLNMFLILSKKWNGTEAATEICLATHVYVIFLLSYSKDTPTQGYTVKDLLFTGNAALAALLHPWRKQFCIRNPAQCARHENSHRETRAAAARFLPFSYLRKKENHKLLWKDQSNSQAYNVNN